MIDSRIPLSEYDGPGEAVIEPSRVIAPIGGARLAAITRSSNSGGNGTIISRTIAMTAPGTSRNEA